MNVVLSTKYWSASLAYSFSVRQGDWELQVTLSDGVTKTSLATVREMEQCRVMADSSQNDISKAIKQDKLVLYRHLYIIVIVITS